MEVWIRIKPEEETKMLLQNTKDNFESNSDLQLKQMNNLIKTVKILMKMISKWWFLDVLFELKGWNWWNKKKKYLCHGPAEINYFQFGYFSANVTNTLKTILKDKVVGVVLHSLSVCYHRGGVDSVCHRVQLMT